MVTLAELVLDSFNNLQYTYMKLRGFIYNDYVAHWMNFDISMNYCLILSVIRES